MKICAAEREKHEQKADLIRVFSYYFIGRKPNQPKSNKLTSSVKNRNAFLSDGFRVNDRTAISVFIYGANAEKEIVLRHFFGSVS